jgi:hypothetical protein
MRTPIPRSFLLAAAALFLLAAPARAQLLIGYLLGEKLTTPTLSFGFELGANFASLDGLDGAGSVTKPVFGIFADWRFSEHFHLGSSFLPLAGRGADGITPVPTGDPALDAQTAGGMMARTLGYLEFPVLLRWAPMRETGFRIGAGPSFGFITSATDRYDATTPDGAPYVLERDIEGEIPGLDVGLAVDAEWRLAVIALGVRYTHGLTDLRQEGAPEAVRTRAVTASGRIYLGRQKAKAPVAGAVPED